MSLDGIHTWRGNSIHYITMAVDDGAQMYTRVWRNAPEGGRAEMRNATRRITCSCCPLAPGGRARVWLTHPFLSIVHLSDMGRPCTRVTDSRPTICLRRDSLSYMRTTCPGLDSGDECSALLIYNVYGESIVGFAGKNALAGERVARVYPIPPVNVIFCDAGFHPSSRDFAWRVRKGANFIWSRRSQIH